MKGKFLLWGSSPVEADVLWAMLTAVGLKVVTVPLIPVRHPGVVAVDAVIVAGPEPDVNLKLLCQLIRRITDRPDVPILVLLPQPPANPILGVRTLHRPTRCLELVSALKLLLKRRGPEASTG